MLDPSDCISITDKTFDLSLDDPLSDVSVTAVDSPAQHNHTTTVGGNHASPLKPHRFMTLFDNIENTDIETTSRSKLSDAQPVWKPYRHVLQPVNQVNNTTGMTKDTTPVSTTRTEPDQYLIPKLQKAVQQLMQISGNDGAPTTHETGLAALVEMVADLTDSSEYKMKFLTKNYSFLESMYDTTRRESDGLKLELSREQEQKLQLEHQLQEARHREQQLKEQLKQAAVISAMTSAKDNPQVQQLQEIVKRQQREIKEYKLFIKQMMDRE